ncbi:MAG TPA: macro domain-containing protein, partial [Accumulibacter sp.]|uniref:macro domain-containing protein n=1 Tax=Accumulibacter sp. TaxID=2053492 RepID=UPI002BAFCE9B
RTLRRRLTRASGRSSACQNPGIRSARIPIAEFGTRGYRLPARYIIHTVGPVWRGGTHGEAELLVSCYRRAIDLAAANDLRTLAIPSISTGVYGDPVGQAPRVAVATVRSSRKTRCTIDGVIFCCFSASDLLVYEDLLGATSN